MRDTLAVMDFSRKGKKVTNAAGKEITHRADLTTFSLSSISDITEQPLIVSVDVDNIDQYIEVAIGRWRFSTANRSGIKAAITTLNGGVGITLYAPVCSYPDVSLVQKITDIDYEALESQVGIQLHGKAFEPCNGVSIGLDNAVFRFVFE